MSELAPCERQALECYPLRHELYDRAVRGEQLLSSELFCLAVLVEPLSSLLASAIRYRATTGLEDPECGK